MLFQNLTPTKTLVILALAIRAFAIFLWAWVWLCPLAFWNGVLWAWRATAAR